MTRRRAGYVEVTLAGANVPESRKRGLDQDRERRARNVIRWMNRHGVDIAAVQESGTYLQREIRRRRAWQGWYAPRNDVVRGREIGNGQVSRKRARIISAEALRSRRTGRGGDLNLTAVGYDLKDAEFVVIGFHRQTRRADPLGRSRRAMNTTLKRYSRNLDAQGIPHVIAGDANEGRRWARKFKWLKSAGCHGVDHILVSRQIEVVSSRAFRDQRDLSDHAFLVADLLIPKKEN